MNNQLKILSLTLELKSYLKKEDSVTFDDTNMILALGCDKGTEIG